MTDMVGGANWWTVLEDAVIIKKSLTRTRPELLRTTTIILLLDCVTVTAKKD